MGHYDLSFNDIITNNTQLNRTILEFEGTVFVPLPSSEERHFRLEVEQHKETLEDALRHEILPESGIPDWDFDIEPIEYPD